MNALVKARMLLFLLALIVMAAMSSCSSPNSPGKPAITPQSSLQAPAAAPEKTIALPATPPPAAEKKPATESPGAAPPAPSATLQANRVDVVYFHMPFRCAACICFEERSDYVVKTYFRDELNSGKLTFQICDLSDRSKAALIRKYDAYGSQLFITRVRNGAEKTDNILGIWRWTCSSNGGEFDEKVKSLIEQALRETS